jgi:fucose 4-O-acetylase-like acetyltransferase
VAGPAVDRPLPGLLKSRFLGLVVPFLSWYVAVQAVSRVLTGRPHLFEAARNIYVSVDYGLWFLWVLFVATMIVALCARVPVVPRWVTLLVVLVALQLVPTSVLGLGLIRWYFAFFAAGVLLSGRVLSGNVLERRWPIWVAGAVVVAYVALAIGWRRVELVPLAQWWQANHLLGVKSLDLGYRYAAAAAGIAMSLLVAKGLRSLPVAATGMRFLGRRTLDIYVSHQWILNAFGGAGIIWAPVAAIVAGGGAIVVAMVARRVTPLRVLFYGGR